MTQYAELDFSHKTASINGGERRYTPAGDPPCSRDNTRAPSKRSTFGWDGIKVPATASVKNYADTTNKTLLEFCVSLYGATTNRRYDVACESCQKREGKRRGAPNLVDFKAEYDMIEPTDGKIRVEFKFCCYPKCHKQGDMEYM